MNSYDEWNGVKKDISKAECRWFVKEREIYWAYLGKNIGYEQDGKDELFLRPVLIFKIFNQHVFYAIPLTTKGNNTKFYYHFRVSDVDNYAILSQMKLMDKRRIHDKLGKIDKEEFEKLKEKLKELLGF